MFSHKYSPLEIEFLQNLLDDFNIKINSVFKNDDCSVNFRIDFAVFLNSSIDLLTQIIDENRAS